MGFASESDLNQVLGNKFDFENRMQDIKERADLAERAYEHFRNLQQGDDSGGRGIGEAKSEVQKRLAELRAELDELLAGEYGIKTKDGLRKFQHSHQPFHWFVEFFGIMNSGGFDSVIGNPPYVEYSKVRSSYTVKGYSTEPSGNLYNFVTERSTHLLRRNGWLGLIIPLGAFSTARMETFQNFTAREFETVYLSYFSGDAHPSVLFEGVKYRLAIIVGKRNRVDAATIYTSPYLRWYADERPHLFSKITYECSPFTAGYLRFAKLGSPECTNVMSKLRSRQRELGQQLRKDGPAVIHYHRSPVFWIRAMTFEPYFHSATRNRSDDHLRDLFFDDKDTASSIAAVLNSTAFYFWFITQGNCRDVAGPDVLNFPLGDLPASTKKTLASRCAALMKDLQKHSRRRVYNYETSGRVEYDEFYPKHSKECIDEIDSVLGVHYGLTDSEIDWLLNFDVKYRLGRESLESGDEDESIGASA